MEFKEESALAIDHNIKEKLSNLEVESSLLGSVLLNNNILARLVEDDPPLTSMMFTDVKHREIAKAMLALYDTAPSQSIDFVTLTEQLRKNDTLEFVGEATIIKLIEDTPTAEHYEAYYRQLVELHIRRLGVALGNQVSQTAVSGDFKTLTQDVLTWTNVLLNPFSDLSSIIPASEAVASADADIRRVLESGTDIIGMTTGFEDIDKHLGGLPPGEVSVMLGDTSMGKTQMGLQWAVHGAELGFKPLIFSMEMTRKTLVQRLIANRMEVSVLDLKRAILTSEQWDQYEEAKDWVSNLDLYIDDTAALSASELRLKALRSFNTLGVRFILVDYLQLLIPEPGSQGDDWGYSTVTRSMRELHTLARSFNAHVCILANTNRAIMNSADKKPEKHHGAGSGAIEKYTDFIFGLYRYGAYHPDDPTRQNLGEFRILKFRNGPVADIPLGWGNETGRWLNRRDVDTSADEQAGFVAGIDF